MHEVRFRLGNGLWQALRERCSRTGESIDHVISTSLAEVLDVDHHTIYQVSTSGALVKGVYQGCVSVGEIRRHGDFGLGTFDGLDGEGILLDGACWQARADGSVRRVSDEIKTPFWVATRFQCDRAETLAGVPGWNDLASRLDRMRRGNNLFMAIRIRGRFRKIRFRAACKVAEGTDLVSATSHQAEFTMVDVSGTLIGFWTPEYARTLNVPGYHLHFLSDDHLHGGHVLELEAEELRVELHEENHLQLILPETPSFLAADLNGDPTEALAKAEGDHRTA